MPGKVKKVLEWSLIFLISLSALAFASLLSYQHAYAGRIYRNVYFGTIDLSGLSKTEADKLLQDRFKTLTSEQIVISSGEKKVNATLADTGLSFNSKEIIDNLYYAGRGNNFWRNIRGASQTLLKKIVIEAKPTINQAAFENFKNIAIKQLNMDPVDASISIVDGTVAEVKSQNGQIVVIDDLVDKIIDVISDSAKTITLDRQIEYPHLKSSDFGEAKQDAESLLNKKIIFFNDKTTYEPSRKEIGAWIAFKKNGDNYKAEIDESAVKAYLNKIASGFETRKVDKKVSAQTGTVLQEGRDGLYLNKDTVFQDLTKKLKETDIRVELLTYKEAFKEISVSMIDGVELGRFEGKYIDINLSTQKFCIIEGQNLIDCFMTSTGKPSMPTPTGTFSVLNKKPMGFSSIYGLYMPWWQQIYGPIGIHELVVFPNGVHETTDHLGQTVSHGCIRLGPGTAERVFNWTEIGTPVIVHK